MKEMTGLLVKLLCGELYGKLMTLLLVVAVVLLALNPVLSHFFG